MGLFLLKFDNIAFVIFLFAKCFKEISLILVITMETSNIQPISNEPVLYIKNSKILVVADLHIGIESELRQQGLNVPNQTKKMLEKIISLCKKYKPNNIICLGDIKHNIPTSTIQERKDVKKFLEEIKEHSIINIVPGNHDGNIHRLTSEEILIHSSKGFILDDIGFVHGHRWPSSEIMQTRHIIMAHTHPTVMLTDRLEHRSFEPCWIKTTFNKNKLLERYPDSKNPELFVMPAFNPLCGGIPVNKDGIMGPFGKIIDLEKSKIFLLDGALLGEIKNIKLS